MTIRFILSLSHNPFSVAALLVIFLASAPTFAQASTLELVKAVNLSFDWNNNYVSPDKRERLARRFNDYWKSFSNRIPRLSPTEAAYVDGERNSGSAERLVSLAQRREFSLWFLLDRSEFCQRIYSMLSIPNIDDRREGYLWAKTQTCYRNRDEVAAHLEQAGLSKGHAGAFNIAMFGMWEAWAIDVLVGSVLAPPEVSP